MLCFKLCLSQLSTMKKRMAERKQRRLKELKEKQEQEREELVRTSNQT